LHSMRHPWLLSFKLNSVVRILHWRGFDKESNNLRETNKVPTIPAQLDKIDRSMK